MTETKHWPTPATTDAVVEVSPEALATIDRLNAPIAIARLRALLESGPTHFLGAQGVADDVAEVLKQRDMLLAALKLAQRDLTTAANIARVCHLTHSTEALDVANDVIARCDP